MNKFYMNGKLIHKASDHNTKRCEVEKWVFLPHSDFERLKANPDQEHEAITAARDLMYEDKNAYHCIMLLDEHGDDRYHKKRILNLKYSITESPVKGDYYYQKPYDSF